MGGTSYDYISHPRGQESLPYTFNGPILHYCLGSRMLLLPYQETRCHDVGCM